jgi:hypothetical protein
MATTQVFPVDPSYFNKPNCFQLIRAVGTFSTGGGGAMATIANSVPVPIPGAGGGGGGGDMAHDTEKTMYLCALSESELRSWISILTRQSFCCLSCARIRLTQPIPQAPAGGAFLTGGERFRKVRSVSVRVTEAKDLDVGMQLLVKSDLYVVVMFDNVRMAKTIPKTAVASPFWGEDFFFEFVSSHFYPFFHPLKRKKKTKKRFCGS